MQNDDNDSLIAASVASSSQGGRTGGLSPYSKSNNSNNPSDSWSSSAFLPSIFNFSSTTKAEAKHDDNEEEMVVDFDETFVTVHENDADEVDILLNGGDPGTGGHVPEDPPLDALAVLLSGSAQTSPEAMVSLSEQATVQMNRAVHETKNGNMQEAMDAHSAAARLFHEAAVELREKNGAMAESFLLLSQTEAKAALGLKRIMKARPHLHPRGGLEGDNGISGNNKHNTSAQSERIRETVRGALDKQQPQEDLSESVFLGRATKGPYQPPSAKPAPSTVSTDQGSGSNNSTNPIDEMMKLERDLREMDMALELGGSIASLDTKSRMKTMDGSFMVVPPGSSSYMSSSMVLTPSTPPIVPSPPRSAGSNRPVEIIGGTAGARARANRVQSISAHPQSRPTPTNTTSAPIVAPAPRSGNGLESSWWGGSSATAASQVLSSSVISLASNNSTGGSSSVPGGSSAGGNDNQANNKQLMRLMDSLKRLGDENAALLKEVEQAEAARAEAKAARQEMRRFQQEYNKRFEILKSTLDKFRKSFEQQTDGALNATALQNKDNPVTTSEFLIAQTTSEQLARQEQLIRKLTADLKKEKEDAKKKEVIFRRYESFYRDVKAMSAQKAAQRKKEQQQQQQQSKNRLSTVQSSKTPPQI